MILDLSSQVGVFGAASVYLDLEKKYINAEKIGTEPGYLRVSTWK